jgi:hypothetical protein
MKDWAGRGLTAEPFSHDHPMATALAAVNRQSSLRGQAATGFHDPYSLAKAVNSSFTSLISSAVTSPDV